MKNVLIIGIGNPLRGDDGLGWHATQVLAQIYDSNPNVVVQHVQQLTMDLVEPIGQVDLVIFIDARLGDEIGKVDVTPIKPNSRLDSPVSHFFDPDTLLSAVQGLYGEHPPATVVSVTSNLFDITEALSPAIAQKVPVVIEAIADLIAAEA
ncbi:MAG: hydrogenase maturation protease [Anaerolineales bacterium]|nr:hydrogenase maturation protease [Anaerolineales bacterium]